MDTTSYLLTINLYCMLFLSQNFVAKFLSSIINYHGISKNSHKLSNSQSTTSPKQR